VRLLVKEVLVADNTIVIRLRQAKPGRGGRT